MKKIILIFLFVLATLIIPNISGNNISEIKPIKGDELEVGVDAVDFNLRDFYNDNNYYSLSDFEGKVLLLDLMASWCGPCQASMPEMVKLHEFLIDTGKFEIISIGVDQSEPRSDLEWFDETFGIAWPMSQDHDGAIGSDSFSSVYGTGYVPSYYIVTPDRKISYANVGWEGLEIVLLEVMKVMDITDAEAPVFHYYYDSMEAGDQAELSILNNAIDFKVNVTDNNLVESVKAEISIDGVYYATPKLSRVDNVQWAGKIGVFPIDLYDAKKVDIKLIATDYYNNSKAYTSKSFDVTFVEDDVKPTINLGKGTHFLNDELNKIYFELNAKDDYAIRSASVLEYSSEDATAVEHQMEKEGAGIYSLNIEYDLSINLHSYHYEFKIVDLGHNVIISPIAVDFQGEPPEEGFLPININFFIFALVAIPIMKKLKKL